MSIARYPSAAFDNIAELYDEMFTRTLVGRIQRDAVWEIARRHFQAGDSILELNCGTGEDAFFLAASGMNVLACDISSGMIEVANRRKERSRVGPEVEFLVLATEDLRVLHDGPRFDGVFSNFSGLNCVGDLGAVAQNLARLIRPGGRAVLCLTNKYCLWEMAWYSLRGRFRKAFRRWTSDGISASVGNGTVTVHYPTLRHILKSFSQNFKPLEVRGVGIAVPPSYIEAWVRNKQWWLSLASSLDRRISRLPLLRGLGDHIVIALERTFP